MDDQSFDELMREAAGRYREPPPPPLDAMWARIEREHFGAATHQSVRPFMRRSGGLRWLRPALAVAASLVIGIAIGRATAPDASATSVADETGIESRTPAPYRAVTRRYLGQAAALLVSLPRSAGRAPEPGLLDRAGELLSTTRLLLDSPAADDPDLRILLDDLELVLAQVVRLTDHRHSEELELITDALEQRDVLPRLQDAVTHSLSATN
jgi:hypothetical protein